MKANPLTDSVKITVRKPEREAGLAATTGYAVRAMNPRQGDFVSKDSTLIEVMGVADGIVTYEVRGDGWKLDRQTPIDDWPRLMRRALKQGATFNAA